MDIKDELKQMLRYEPDTGFLYWTDAAHKSVRNKVAGTLNRGYIIVMFKGQFFKAHRIAWLLTHGDWPKQSIDHIDGDKSNNKLENLYLCDHSKHRAVDLSAIQLVYALLKEGVVKFNQETGTYMKK